MKLSNDEKLAISQALWTHCLKHYKERMRASGLVAKFETEEDLEGEAYIAMWNVLNKFDQKDESNKFEEFKEFYNERVAFIADSALESKRS